MRFTVKCTESCHFLLSFLPALTRKSRSRQLQRSSDLTVLTFVSSYPITVQVNMPYLYRQNCTTHQTPCCMQWRTAPVCLGKYPVATLNIRVRRAGRKKQIQPHSCFCLSSVEGELKVEDKERTGLAVPTHFLLHMWIVVTTGRGQAGRQGRSPVD